MRHLSILTIVLLWAGSLQSAPVGAVVQGWHYDFQSKTIKLTIANTSLKEISAYNILVRVTHLDGSVNVSERSEDFLPLMASIERIGASLYKEHGDGAFLPGAIRDEVITETEDVSDVSATVDVVVYADLTADVQNDRAFSRIVAQRKGALLATQKPPKF